MDRTAACPHRSPRRHDVISRSSRVPCCNPRNAQGDQQKKKKSPLGAKIAVTTGISGDVTRQPPRHPASISRTARRCVDRVAIAARNVAPHIANEGLTPPAALPAVGNIAQSLALFTLRRSGTSGHDEAPGHPIHGVWISRYRYGHLARRGPPLREDKPSTCGQTLPSPVSRAASESR